jgi:hypothetical protein
MLILAWGYIATCVRAANVHSLSCAAGPACRSRCGVTPRRSRCTRWSGWRAEAWPKPGRNSFSEKLGRRNRVRADSSRVPAVTSVIQLFDPTNDSP